VRETVVGRTDRDCTSWQKMEVFFFHTQHRQTHTHTNIYNTIEVSLCSYYVVRLTHLRLRHTWWLAFCAADPKPNTTYREIAVHVVSWSFNMYRSFLLAAKWFLLMWEPNIGKYQNWWRPSSSDVVISGLSKCKDIPVIPPTVNKIIKKKT